MLKLSYMLMLPILCVCFVNRLCLYVSFSFSCILLRIFVFFFVSGLASFLFFIVWVVVIRCWWCWAHFDLCTVNILARALKCFDIFQFCTTDCFSNSLHTQTICFYCTACLLHSCCCFSF